MLKFSLIFKLLLIISIFYPRKNFAQEKLRITLIPTNNVDTIENEIKEIPLKHIIVENISLSNAEISNIMGMNGFYKVYKKVNEEYLLIDSICEGMEDFFLPKEGVQTIDFKKGDKIDIPKMATPPCILIKNGGDYRIKYFFHCSVKGKEEVFEAGSYNLFIK